MPRESILIIEDDPDIRQLLSFNLEREGFEVRQAPDGESGLASAWKKPPSLILLDLMLPGIQGLEVCRRLKQRDETRFTPLIMATAKGEESDIVVGLEMGADDYIVKPFSVKETVARIRAVLRRRQTTELPRPIQIGPLAIDSDRHEGVLEGRPLPLTLTEFRILAALASNPGRVRTRDQLLDVITEGKTFVIDRNIDVHIRAIREKLQEHRDLIVTVRGVGYKIDSHAEKDDS